MVHSFFYSKANHNELRKTTPIKHGNENSFVLSPLLRPISESVTFSTIIKLSSQRIAQRIAQMIGPD